MKTLCFILFLHIGSLGVYSCTSRISETDLQSSVQPSKTIRDASVIEYRFTDRSVPPPFHRSYTITVLQDSITVSIYNYSDILYQETRFCSNTELRQAQAAYEAAAIKPDIEKEPSGCTGGVTHHIRVHDGIKDELDLYTYDCGGEKRGNMFGDIHAFSSAMKSLIPDFEQRMAATRNQ